MQQLKDYSIVATGIAVTLAGEAICSASHDVMGTFICHWLACFLIGNTGLRILCEAWKSIVGAVAKQEPVRE